MSSDKSKRALKRHHDQVAVAKQLVICKVHRATIRSPHGVFRKRHALNCGRPRCLMCGNPRRTWGHLTLQEQRASEAFEYELYFV